MGHCAKFIGKSAMAAIAAAALSGLPTGASAQDTMTINANVTRNCQIFALPMMFGTIAFFLPNATTQTSIQVDCTPNTAFTVAIDDGLYVNAGQRRMTRVGPGVGTYLNYEIYRNAARTQRWGSAAGQLVTGVTPANGRVTLTAYGRTTGFLVAGPFQDTVTVTITF